MINKRTESGRIGIVYDVEEMKKLAEEYSVHNNAKEISVRESIPLQTVYYYIRKFEKQKPNRMNNLNEDYFKIINTQEKAYLLGFIAADGCVSRSSLSNPRPNRLFVNISSKDRIVLELLKSELRCDYGIKDYIPGKATFSDHQMSILIINSMKLCDDLAKYGIVPSKTGSEILPTLSENMYRHYIRGFLDGDGYITKSNNVITIGFVSNEYMLNQIRTKLFEELSLQSKAIIHPDYRGKKASYLEFSSQNDITKLKEYLYKRSRFYLERKYAKLT